MFLLLGKTVVATLAYLVEDSVDLCLVGSLTGIIFHVGILRTASLCMHVRISALAAAVMLALVEAAFEILKELLSPATIETRVGMLVPIPYHQESEEHTS